MKRYLLKIALILCMMLLFSSCSLNMSVENLLTPPKLTEEQNAIFQALQSSKGGNITLKYPKSGDYRSAFIIRNIDDEPTDEALVFYQSAGASEENFLWLVFLDQKDGEWICVYDMPAIGTDVEKVVFKELGDSDKVNIIIGYSVLNQTENGISVLTYENQVPVEEYKGTYSVMEFPDPDNDGNAELFLITLNKTIPQSMAYLIGWNDNQFGVLSSVELDSAANEYNSITAGMMDANLSAMFIDYSKGDSTYGTDVIFCSGKNMFSALYSKISTANSDKATRKTNTYTANMTARDIDGDGCMEVAGTSLLPGYTNMNKAEQIYANVWYSITDRYTLVKKYYTYCSTNNDYVFFFPNRWQELVTVTLNSDRSEVYFRTVLSSLAEPTEPLLSIKTVAEADLAKTDVDALIADGWIKVENTENEGYTYFTKQGDAGNQMTLTDDELADCLMFLTEQTR